MEKYECWKINFKEMYVFTKERDVVEYLKRDFPRCAEYYENGHMAGWQFLLPSKLLRVLHNKFGDHSSSEGKLLKFPAVINQQLTGIGNGKYSISGTEQRPLSKSYGEKKIAACG
jgi:hypothetical protein